MSITNPMPNHGTKVLGGIILALGGVETALTSSASCSATLSAALGQYGPAVLTLLTGLLTFFRGFQNSANLAEAPK